MSLSIFSKAIPRLYWVSKHSLYIPVTAYGFKAGSGVVYQLVNRSTDRVVYLEIGDCLERIEELGDFWGAHPGIGLRFISGLLYHPLLCVYS